MRDQATHIGIRTPIVRAPHHIADLVLLQPRIPGITANNRVVKLCLKNRHASIENVRPVRLSAARVVDRRRELIQRVVRLDDERLRRPVIPGRAGVQNYVRGPRITNGGHQLLMKIGRAHV